MSCTVIESQDYCEDTALAPLDHFLLDSFPLAPFRKLADDGEQTAEPKPGFTSCDSQAAISSPESLCYASAFLHVLTVSPLKYTETLV